METGPWELPNVHHVRVLCRRCVCLCRAVCLQRGVSCHVVTLITAAFGQKYFVKHILTMVLIYNLQGNNSSIAVVRGVVSFVSNKTFGLTKTVCLYCLVFCSIL